MSKQTTVYKSQFKSFFTHNNHPSIERRLKKADDLVGVNMVKLFYSVHGRCYKSKYYLDNGESFYGGVLDGYLSHISKHIVK